MKRGSLEGIEGIRQQGLFGRQSAQNLHHSDVSVASKAGGAALEKVGATEGQTAWVVGGSSICWAKEEGRLHESLQKGPGRE